MTQKGGCSDTVRRRSELYRGTSGTRLRPERLTVDEFATPRMQFPSGVLVSRLPTRCIKSLATCSLHRYVIIQEKKGVTTTNALVKCESRTREEPPTRPRERNTRGVLLYAAGRFIPIHTYYLWKISPAYRPAVTGVKKPEVSVKSRVYEFCVRNDTPNAGARAGGEIARVESRTAASGGAVRSVNARAHVWFAVHRRRPLLRRCMHLNCYTFVAISSMTFERFGVP
ncbi:hypothetical protein EVAR_95735_1 [Eumeta japonica]|uniref:Uncharacterized protein n=1 Tax=Eumeta variegata TaxID=151549 RepID=A0A4C1UKU9_EUMVA|nr:hypothetical protein EVAR_95735_1 [Eumeta japonica]